MSNELTIDETYDALHALQRSFRRYDFRTMGPEHPHNYSGERQWEAVTREGKVVAKAKSPEDLRAKL